MTRGRLSRSGNVQHTLSTLLVAVIALPIAAGCKESAPAPAPEKPKAAQAGRGNADDSALMRKFIQENSTENASPNGATLPAGHPPVGNMPRPAPASATLPEGHPPLPAGMTIAKGDQPIDAAAIPLKFDAPESWKAEAPASNMRKAQFLLPRAETDSSDGDMVLFFFGTGQGGSIDANIDRWVSQFSTAEGEPIPESGRVIERTEANGLKITTLDIAGYYSGSMMPGGGTPSDGPKRMLSAIIETPGGAWFFKGTGPLNTMAGHKSAFDAMLRTVRWETNNGEG